MENTNVEFPTAGKWVKSLLRNRIKLELNTPINKVWAVVGDPAKVLTYSSDVNRVETKTDDSGKYTEYTCFYGEDTEDTIRTKILWYEANKGWSSLDEEPNAFGFQQSLAFITLKQQGDKTILSWDMHYDNENDEMLQMSIASLEQSLKNEIAPQLIRKFGGSILETYVYNKLK